MTQPLIVFGMAHRGRMTPLQNNWFTPYAAKVELDQALVPYNK